MADRDAPRSAAAGDPAGEPLAGADAARPLPPELRARLEEVLLAAASGAGTAGRDTGAADGGAAGPGDGPTEGDDRVLVGASSWPSGASGWAGLGAPRAVPPGLRRRLESRLVREAAGPQGRASSERARRWLAAAAALLVVASVAALASVTGPRDGTVVAEGTRPGDRRTPGSAEDGRAEDAGTRGGVAGRGTGAGTVPGDPDDTTTATGGAATSADAPPEGVPGTPGGADGSQPDAAAGMDSAAPGAGSGDGGPGAPPPWSSEREAARLGGDGPVRVAVAGGDTEVRAGFVAYVEAVNAAGGVGGRPIEVTGSTDDVAAVVNVGHRPLAARHDGTPVLETLTVPPEVLDAGTFSASSVLERQAVLAAAHVFPERAPDASAVVFRAADGPYGERVASTVARELRARDVEVTTVVYTGLPVPLPEADAAFASLPPDLLADWVAQVAEEGYRPSRGIAGVASLLDPRLATDLPDGTVALAPYRPSAGDRETGALAAALGRAPDAGAIHGWVTGEHLAVALHRAPSAAPADVARSLAGLPGYRNGWAPYEVRQGTNERTPHALAVEVRGGRFVTTGGFQVASLSGP